MPGTSAAPNAAPNREALTQRRLNRLLNAPNREALTQRRLNRLLNARRYLLVPASAAAFADVPCSSHFLDGRGIRSAVAATDPACRVIWPFIAKTIARLRRRFR